MGCGRWWWWDPGVAVVALALLGCAPAERAAQPAPEAHPGQQASDADLSCSSDADCDAGERCEGGRCRLDRCNDIYASGPPLGVTRFFQDEDEVVVISDDHYLDGFESDGGYAGTLDGGAAIVDVVDANFDGGVPRGIAIAYENDWGVDLWLADGLAQLTVSHVIDALAAGDVDGDGLDELIALGGGMLSICDAEAPSCAAHPIPGAVTRDLAAADVDADGFVEPLLLVEQQGGMRVVVYNVDAAQTNQVQRDDFPLNVAPARIAAGDLTGDGSISIALLEDGGWLGFAHDRLHLMNPASGVVEKLFEVDSGSIDVATGDRDGDGREELAILRKDHRIELRALDGGALPLLASIDIVVGDAPQRLVMLDWDGDAPAGVLEEGPVLVSGEIVPTMAVAYPPYPEGIAAGIPGLWVGDSKDVTQQASRTIALELGVSLGIGVELPLLEAEVAAALTRGVAHTTTSKQSLSVSQYYFLDADPSHRRDQSGAVVVSCGCYHRYRYRTVDPRGLLSPSGQTFEVMVPVGGQSQLWSTARYNAMARELGTIPEIHIPYVVGDMGSYPAVPTRHDGAPIDPADQLFVDPPRYQSSEIAEIEFWLLAGETATNESVASVEIGTQASFGAGIIEAELSAQAGLSQGYSISVGTEALFIGWVPSVPDNPSTPEDEGTMYSYAFTPYVYRHHYVDAAGQTAAYYAMTYTTSQKPR